MTTELRPVPCPRCGEAQNTMPGGFDPAAEPFGPVRCMVCAHLFSRDEYLRGLERALGRERDATTASS